MKKKIHYETPLLIDMRSSHATGAATACDGGVYADACGLGSSITLSYCGQGWDAQWCTGQGSAANTKGDYCIACCETGTSVFGTIPGSKASYCICSVGNSAGLLCTTGAIANSECNPTGGYAGYCA